MRMHLLNWDYAGHIARLQTDVQIYGGDNEEGRRNPKYKLRADIARDAGHGVGDEREESIE